MSAPVSWLEVRPGWRVTASDGHEVGEVDEVAGDERRDIFDGISIATSALGQPAYAPAENVERIEEGVVRLALTREQVAQLGPYLQPASSLRVEPDDHRSAGEAIEAEARSIGGRVLEPTGRHARPFNVFTRLAHLVRRKRHR